MDVPPQYVEAREGGSITLSCTAFGNPKPVVTWLREGEQLATNKKYMVMSAQVHWMIQLMWCNLQMPASEKQKTEHVYWFGLTLQTWLYSCSGNKGTVLLCFERKELMLNKVLSRACVGWADRRRSTIVWSEFETLTRWERGREECENSLCWIWQKHSGSLAPAGFVWLHIRAAPMLKDRDREVKKR